MNSRDDDDGTTGGRPRRDGRNIWDGAGGAAPALFAVPRRAPPLPGHGGRTPWAASAAVRRARDAGGVRGRCRPIDDPRIRVRETDVIITLLSYDIQYNTIIIQYII